MNPVQAQYEKYPYPPIPWLALPKRGEGASLAFERGLKLAGRNQNHDGARILVAGCGTFEPLIVAQQNSRAAEVVAVDFSYEALKCLKKRFALARLAGVLRPWAKGSIAPTCLLHADLTTWSDGLFDCIFASNVLHHTEDPSAMLMRLSSMLRPGGLMRVVTYPRHSRLWMRLTREWFASQGMSAESPDLILSAKNAVRRLPSGHPIRGCFESQPETRSRTGLIDAFFNAQEKPLSPLEWKAASAQASLKWIAEDQREDCRGATLVSLIPTTQALDPWERLQVLDDTLELVVNPVLWFEKSTPQQSCIEFPIHSDIHWVDRPDWASAQVSLEIEGALNRADHILKKVGSSLLALHAALKIRDQDLQDYPVPLLSDFSFTEVTGAAAAAARL